MSPAVGTSEGGDARARDARGEGTHTSASFACASIIERFFRWFLRHSLSALRPELYEIDLDAGRIRHRPRLGFGSEVPFDGIDAIEGITLRLGTRTRTRSGGKTTRHAFEATDIRLWPVLKGGAESLAVWPFGEDCARDRKDEAVSLATILSERLSLPPPTIEDFRRDRDEGGAPS